MLDSPSMRSIPIALLPLIASAPSLNTSGSATINYTFCSDPTNASTCQPGTQSAVGTNLHVGSASIIGALDLTVIAGYRGVFLEANANTGIVGGPPSPNIPNVVTNASVQGSAGFQDVIHFLGIQEPHPCPATVTCMCLRLDDASAIASFQLGSVNVTNADGMYIPSPFSGHMTTPFALNGSIAISISATVTATDSNPSDPLSGASFARVSAGLGGFILTNAAGMPIVVQYYSDSGDALPWFGRVRPRAGNVGTYGTIAAWSGPVAMSRLRRHGR